MNNKKYKKTALIMEGGAMRGLFTCGVMDVLLENGIAFDGCAGISAGAVFMGAVTYIGNAPNFMVKSIAEENKIKMPSFFGYMAWSCAILIPLFVVDMFVFFW